MLRTLRDGIQDAGGYDDDDDDDDDDDSLHPSSLVEERDSPYPYSNLLPPLLNTRLLNSD